MLTGGGDSDLKENLLADFLSGCGPGGEACLIDIRNPEVWVAVAGRARLKLLSLLVEPRRRSGGGWVACLLWAGSACGERLDATRALAVAGTTGSDAGRVAFALDCSTSEIRAASSPLALGPLDRIDFRK